jgi:hypothetical protein
VRDAITSLDYDQYIQEMVDWVEEHKTEGLMEAAVVGVWRPDGEPVGVWLVSARRGLWLRPSHAGNARL